MPAIFRLVNHTLAGQGNLNHLSKSISNLALQDLTLAKKRKQNGVGFLNEV